MHLRQLMYILHQTTLSASHLQHTLREIFIRLPNTQISQNLLRTTQNRIELVRAVEHFHHTTHTRLREATTTEDVDRLVGDLVCGAGSVGLEEADGTTEEF